MTVRQTICLFKFKRSSFQASSSELFNGPALQSQCAYYQNTIFVIQLLVAEYETDEIDVYMLCSVAGDLKMHEVVS
jgi:acetamidase/formamidase